MLKQHNSKPGRASALPTSERNRNMTSNNITGDRIAERLKQLDKNPDQPYFIRYRIESGRFGKQDAGNNEGLTQDLIFVSCITHPDGSYSQLWHAMNGATGDVLHHDDVFKAWILLASSLRGKVDLSPDKRAFLDNVFETWRSVMLDDTEEDVA